MRFHGVFAPVPTPFDRSGAVNLRRLRVAFARWVASPLTGFVVLGSSGEAVLIDEVESDRVVAAGRESVPQGRPFIVGTGRESTEHTVNASKRAAALGADAVLVKTPGFFKGQMTPGAFVRHYETVADSTPVPVLLYNYTAATGVELTPDAVARVAEHPNVVGMKESGGAIERLTALVSAVPSGFDVLAGSARTFCDALRVGASGGVLPLAAVIPDACVKMYDLVRAGSDLEATELQARVAPLAELVSSRLSVPGLKSALNLTGFDVGYPRAPLQALSEDEVASVRAALQTFQAT